MSRVHGRYKISINVERRGFSLPGGGPAMSTIVLFTRDRRMARFFLAKGASAATWAAARRAVSRFTCMDLYSGRRFVRLERSLAKALLRRYRSSTHRSGSLPDIMLSMMYATPMGASFGACRPASRKRKPRCG